MAQKCGICIHPDREKIEKAIISGTTLREISGKWEISKSAIDRHKKDHLPTKLVKAAETREINTAGALLDQLFEITRETEAILKEMRKKGNDKDNRGALFALRRLERQLELQAQLLGRLGPSTAVQVNVGIPSLTTSPEWPVLMQVLQRYPGIHEELKVALAEAGL
jgi:hypothetical protein